jgi:HD-GYP domain-containing protein (c-di-GMP phosphodiesterase class II)
LSLATDLDVGQPLEHALRTCLLALRLGRAYGLSEEELTDIYYLALVRYVGCTANQHVDAAVLGDDLAARRWVLAVDFGDQAQFLGKLRQHAGTEERFAQALAGLERTLGETMAAHCEAGERFAQQLGLSAVVQTALTQVYERWDGKGSPRGLAGEAIARPLRFVQLAHQVQIYHREHGVEAAVAVARQRAGGWYDPSIVECFCADARDLLDGPRDSADSWDAVLAAEPGPRPVVAGEDLDRCLEAMADFADLQSPQFSGHSRGVAELAQAAAVCYGLPAAEANRIRRAGLVHDLGRLAVPAAIFGKSDRLSNGDWERIRLHPYFTERVLSRPKALAALGVLAGRHHERIDGSGYHVGLRGPLLSDSARILGAADVYHALTEPRVHRPAHSPANAAAQLQREVQTGRLDDRAAEAVLVAAGHRSSARRRTWPAGLTTREVEVLRLLARGLINREIGRTLCLTESTVHNHVLHVYDKIGASTRAGATLFAMQRDLLDGLLAER